MNNKMPRTPFSTPLSGSAKETELRIRNIMSGPKKRPPVLLLVLMFAVCIFCGNLVSCQIAAETPPKGSDRSAVSSVPEENQAIPIDPEYPPQNEEEEWLLQALFQAAERESPFQLPTARLLAVVSGDGCVLGAAFVEDHLDNTLILGVMDRESRELTGSIYRYTMKNAVPNVVLFQNYDGESCLLYTFNGQIIGQYSGEAGAVCFNQSGITWTWPVEGDVRDPNSSAYQEYKDYWTGHLAVAAPGGVDIYTVNPEFEWGKEEPRSMWQLEYDELFYADPSSSTELPMPVYFQSLNWLVEYTNDPGGWRVVSLTLNEDRCDPENQTDCYTLQAREELGTGEMVVDLFFPYETESSRPRMYDKPDRTDIYDSYEAYTKAYVEQ